MGPKKLLSTVSVDVPSMAWMRKRNAWRPLVARGAVTISGTDSTCCAPAGTTTRGPPVSTMPGAASISTRYVCGRSVLLTSFSV